MDLTPELLKEIISSVIAANNAQNNSKQETNFQVKPPEPFNFQDQSTWTSWIKRFKMFRSATGLSGKSEEQQINMLL